MSNLGRFESEKEKFNLMFRTSLDFKYRLQVLFTLTIISRIKAIDVDKFSFASDVIDQGTLKC